MIKFVKEEKRQRVIERMRKVVEKPNPTEDEVKRMIVEAEEAYQTEHELYDKLKDMWKNIQDQKVAPVTVVAPEPDNESEDMKQRRVRCP